MLEIYSSHPDGFSNGVVKLSFYKDKRKIKTAGFKVPLDFRVSNDCVAAAAIAIRPFDCPDISFNFPVSEQAKKIANRDYRINIASPTGSATEAASRHASYLNFSGGIDSLAAHYLLGDVARNISVDFGGHFKREADWFREWPTDCIETDFRDKPFNESLDWRFMGACAMLYADYLQIETVYWGTVLEASPYWFSSKKKVDADGAESTHAFALAGIKMAQTVTPLSEFGTMKIALELGEDTVHKSIISCAAPHSEKSIRKHLLAYLAQGRKVDASFFNSNRCARKYVFGSSFAVDILTLYFISSIGIELVRTFLAEIDEQQLDAVRDIDMRFFEKYNPSNLESIPKRVRSQIIAGYETAGIVPYTPHDFIALNALRANLQQAYRFV